MNDKVTQLKPKKKVPIYYIICEGNRNPIAQTYSIDSARMLRDQLEDLWIDYWNDEYNAKPLTTRYSISVS
tara:strand:- start:1473 stop:1685 length:213 start_codon:yes stop_codon:yes gene_type:complete